MSYKELGTNYSCDLCGEVNHSDYGLPDFWSTIEAVHINGYCKKIRLHVCHTCWPEMPKTAVKSLIRKFLDKCRVIK